MYDSGALVKIFIPSPIGLCRIVVIQPDDLFPACLLGLRSFQNTLFASQNHVWRWQDLLPCNYAAPFVKVRAQWIMPVRAR